MTTLALTFPGQVPFDDPTVPAGGCGYGQVRCVEPAEVEVVLPATNDSRWLCRGHVGYYMLGVTSMSRYSVVEVRQLSQPDRMSERTGHLDR